MRVRVLAFVVIIMFIIAGCGTCPPAPPSEVTPSEAVVSASDDVAPSDSRDYVPESPLAEYHSLFPLIAAVPEKGWYFYGLWGEPGGIVLYKITGEIPDQSSNATWFDWRWHPGYEKFAFCRDCDGDGEEELVFGGHWGAGTGLCVSELHMLKPTAPDYDNHIYGWQYEDYELSNENIPQHIDDMLSFRYKEKGTVIEIELDGKTYGIPNEYADYEEHGKISGFYSGDWVRIEMDDEGTITADIGIHFRFGKDLVPYMGIGGIHAEVAFDGKDFSLINPEISLYDRDGNVLYEP